MKKKGKVTKIFEDYGVFILFQFEEVHIIKIYPQTESPRKTGYIWVSDWIPESLTRHVGPSARTRPSSVLSLG
jgi:hypothetical protein